MKKKYSIITKKSIATAIVFLFCTNLFAQTTIYSTDFENAGSFPTGWSAGGGGTLYTTSTTSSQTAGTYNVSNGSSGNTLIYSSLSTVGYVNITVSWQQRRTSTGTLPTFYWSSDGSTWNSVSFNDVINQSTWEPVTAIALPSGAENQATLQFKWFSNSTAGTYRMDDFTVQTNTSNGYWSLTGNNNTTGSSFVGTTTAQDLIFKANTGTMTFLQNGNLGIGTPTPSAKLEIVHTDGAGISAGMALTNLSTANKNSEIKFNQNTTALWAIGNDVAHDNSQNFFIYDNIANSGFGAARLFIDANGKVGIGETNPTEQFMVTHNDGVGVSGGIGLKNSSTANKNSEVKFYQNSTPLWAIGNDVTHTNLQNFFIYDEVANVTRFLIDGDGKVLIGSPTVGTSNLYKLYVEGGITARDVKVTAGAFPDYVFEKNYDLMSIYELEKYISKNHHLPEIPSAKEIEKNEGYEIGDMQTKLVKKVEEQTLYIIDLQKQMDELKKQVLELKNK